jgi:hypothetical protein
MFPAVYSVAPPALSNQLNVELNDQKISGQISG